MILKKRIWNLCPTCNQTTHVIQEATTGCDYCKKVIQNNPNEVLDVTVFWKPGKMKEPTNYEYCSWVCFAEAMKKFVRKRDIEFISLPLVPFTNTCKGTTPKDFASLLK